MRYFSAILIILAFLISVSVVFGAETGLTIRPIKISQTIKAGESFSDSIFLKNESSDEVNVKISMQDFVPSAGSEKYKFVGRAGGNTTVRDWLSFNLPEDFLFKKGDEKSVKYTIKVPEDAEPGGHYGAVFFEATEIGPTGTLKIGTRVGALFFVTVPGNQLQKGKILGFTGPKFIQKGPVDFKIKFENTGTVHFEPKGTIKITNISGKEVGEVSVSGQVLLPTGVREWIVKWETAGILLGRYKAILRLVDGEGNELTAESVSFYAFPLWYLASFVLGVLAIFFGLKFVRSKFSFTIAKKQ